MGDAWSNFWADVSVLQLTAWVVGGVIVLTFTVKGWPILKGLVRLVDAIPALQELPKFMAATTQTLKDQDVKIEQIHHEVNYNNGSSVKDAVQRVELGVKGLYDRTDILTKDNLDMHEELERTRPKPAPRKRVAKPKESQ